MQKEIFDPKKELNLTMVQYLSRNKNKQKQKKALVYANNKLQKKRQIHEH